MKCLIKDHWGRGGGQTMLLPQGLAYLLVINARGYLKLLMRFSRTKFRMKNDESSSSKCVSPQISPNLNNALGLFHQ